MIVYSLKSGPRGWSVLRDGQPLGLYASAQKALAIAKQFAQREKEQQGMETEVWPIVIKAPCPTPIA